MVGGNEECDRCWANCSKGEKPIPPIESKGGPTKTEKNDRTARERAGCEKQETCVKRGKLVVEKHREPSLGDGQKKLLSNWKSKKFVFH